MNSINLSVVTRLYVYSDVQLPVSLSTVMYRINLSVCLSTVMYRINLSVCLSTVMYRITLSVYSDVPY